ncbi:hypothetical protein ACGFS9_31465 [Streptomyces sp. NPDC048566]|uniref:hypothetical protein n=1 Tax=Streptomyces sp. NPDC048566 TaxID=3365569 RepID=UPI00371EDEF2
MTDFETTMRNANLGELHEDHPGLAPESGPTITSLAEAQVMWNAGQALVGTGLTAALIG